MKCQVCNAEAPQGASFCQHCGAKLPAFENASMDAGLDDTRETAVEPTSETSRAPREGSTAKAPRRGRDVPEEALWEGSFSPKAMLPLAVGCGLLSLALLVAAIWVGPGAIRWILLAVIVVAWLGVAVRLAQRRLGISYRLTTHMFYHQHGLLTRVTDRIELIEIHDVTYFQSLLERPVNVGKIKIASGDRTDPMLLLTGVEDVERVAQMIDKARRGEQVRRGRRIDFSHIDGET